MLELVFSLISNPRKLLIVILPVLSFILAGVCIHLLHQHNTLIKSNTILQQNEKQLQIINQQQKQQLETQNQLMVNNLNIVHQDDVEQNQQSIILNDNSSFLQTMKVPTNEVNACANSPYISTIISRLRQQNSTSSNSNNSTTSYAYTSK